MPPKVGGKNQKFAKPQNTKGTIKRIMSYIKPFKVKFIFVCTTIILSALASSLGSYLFGYAIQKGILGHMSDTNASLTINYFIHSELGYYVTAMLGVYAIGLICNYINSRLMIYVSTGVMKAVRDDLFVHLQKLPIKYFDTHTHGELMSRFTNDTDALREMLSQGLPQLISSTFSVLFVFGFMISISIPLTLVIILSLFASFAIIKTITGRSRKYFIKNQQQLGVANGYIEEMIEGAKVVKVFTHEETTKQEFDQINEELCDASTKASTYAFLLFPIMGNFSHVLYVVIGAIGAGLVLLTNNGSFDNNGFMKFVFSLQAGFLITYMNYIRQFTNPITQMSQQMNGIYTALAGSERIFNVLDEVPEQDEGYVELVNIKKDDKGNITEVQERTGQWAWKHPHKKDGSVTYTELKGDVVLEDVVFGYDPKKTVLHHVSLYAKPGQKIAFVGSTGAGKTTITNLINRFYDIQSGKIRYDGINIKKIRKDDLRKSLAMVLQDTHLFTGTVMDNIRYGKLDATDEECIEAAKLANADWFIQHLPQGYNTMLTSDGANLSQGQRQLLNIARAAVANPPVLILDEATSSIDTRTETLISAGMDKLMKGRTVFVIAHRLSTVRNSDAIIVLEQGQIIERGDHESLLKEKGKYYQLYTGTLELE